MSGVYSHSYSVLPAVAVTKPYFAGVAPVLARFSDRSGEEDCMTLRQRLVIQEFELLERDKPRNYWRGSNEYRPTAPLQKVSSCRTRMQQVFTEFTGTVNSTETSCFLRVTPTRWGSIFALRFPDLSENLVLSPQCFLVSCLQSLCKKVTRFTASYFAVCMCLLGLE